MQQQDELRQVQLNTQSTMQHRESARREGLALETYSNDVLASMRMTSHEADLSEPSRHGSFNNQE